MQAWDDFLKKQEGRLGKEVVQQWLRALKVVHFDSANLYLEAKDTFQVQWFEEHIRPLVKKAFFNNNFRLIKVHLSLETAATPTHKYPPSEAPSPISFSPDPIDPSMTLHNFVFGQANQVVSAFFDEMISGKQPLATFNPVYIWGDVGSGKTHLLCALCAIFKRRALRALYTRAETFTEHVVKAIRSSEMQAFRRAYRHVDILLIDDVHLFSRKHATQEELFHTFNALHSAGCQIILSSSSPSALLEDIEPRLVSRFEWGVSMHLKNLKAEELKEVVLQRAKNLHFPLSDTMIEFVVDTFPTSKAVHMALEALVLRSHQRSIHSLSLEPKTARHLLADLIEAAAKTVLTPEKIITVVASITGISKKDLLGKSQTQECSLSRQIAMYLCRQELHLSFQGIGRIFSRDHSTVMTSVRQIEKKLEQSDKEIFTFLSDVRFSLNKN